MFDDNKILIKVFSIEINSLSVKSFLVEFSHIIPSVLIADILNSILSESQALHKVIIKLGHSLFLFEICLTAETNMLAEILISSTLSPHKLKEFI